ncbi:hypothetical protein F2Q68_00043896 [Brassica cretica]|uniref:Uncharacterized protein n=1 Tax=Brassica cretica TaxID=69181 RepID=A0A8S9LM24_BRACR|nr:hypothetical protein F2Q68_00043896 [Brassica cretica]
MLYVQIAHNPIFFHSPFTVGLWKIFIGNQLDINPSSASEKIFILQLFTYNMWREHNCRTFRQTSSSERAINEGQASLHSGYVVYSSLYARDLILLHCTFQLRMLTSLSDEAAENFRVKFDACAATPTVLLVTTVNPKRLGGKLCLSSMSSSRVFLDEEVDPTKEYLT